MAPLSLASRRAYLLIAGGLLLLAVLALTIDMPVARACRPNLESKRSVIPRDVQKFLALCETFSHGAGVAAILFSIVLCDPRARHHVWRLLAASFGAGLAADLVKYLLVARQRPNGGSLDHSAIESFVALFPLLSQRFADQPYSRAYQSFPSAHSATAAGLAVALAALYPAGRWWFATLAALCLVQRIDAGAHYPSDTLAGAALGCFVGAIAVGALRTRGSTPQAGVARRVNFQPAKRCTRVGVLECATRT